MYPCHGIGMCFSSTSGVLNAIIGTNSRCRCRYDNENRKRRKLCTERFALPRFSHFQSFAFTFAFILCCQQFGYSIVARRRGGVHTRGDPLRGFLPRPRWDVMPAVGETAALRGWRQLPRKGETLRQSARRRLERRRRSERAARSCSAAASQISTARAGTCAASGQDLF